MQRTLDVVRANAWDSFTRCLGALKTTLDGVDHCTCADACGGTLLRRWELLDARKNLQSKATDSALDLSYYTRTLGLALRSYLSDSEEGMDGYCVGCVIVCY